MGGQRGIALAVQGAEHFEVRSYGEHSKVDAPRGRGLSKAMKKKVDENLYDQAPGKVCNRMYLKLKSPTKKAAFDVKKTRKLFQNRKKWLLKKQTVDHTR